MKSSWLILLFVRAQSSQAEKLWPSSGALPTTIPTSCREALSKDVSCSPRLLTALDVLTEQPLTETLLKDYCTDDCRRSIQSLNNAVQTSCGDTVFAFPNGRDQSGPFISRAISWSYNVSCTKDSAGSFCLQKLFSDKTQKAKPCDNCTFLYQAALLSDSRGEGLVNPAQYSSRVSSCGLSPTAFALPSLPSNPGNTSLTPIQNSTIASCPGNNTYTVKGNETCNDIAVAHSIATDRLIVQNRLSYSCNDIHDGLALCLGDGCQLHEVVANQTCITIAAAFNWTDFELISWNPTIHTNCDNIGDMVNRNICVSPPGPNAKWGSSGTFKPIGVNGSTVTNATVSGTFIPLIDLGSLTAITASPINTSFSTNWNGATPVRAIPTVTIANNSQNFFQQYADRTDGCPWIVGGELSDDYFELSDDCKSSLDPYCIPQLSDSTPQPTAFAPDCLPKSTASNPTASPTAAIKPSPTPTR